MVVATKQVRYALNDISETLISEEVIHQNITQAQVKVDSVKADSVSTTVEDAAVLQYATYLTYLSYTTEIERSIGELPASMAIKLARLRDLAEEYLNIASQGGVTGGSTVGYADDKPLTDIIPVESIIPTDEEYDYVQ